MTSMNSFGEVLGAMFDQNVSTVSKSFAKEMDRNGIVNGRQCGERKFSL